MTRNLDRIVKHIRHETFCQFERDLMHNPALILEQDLMDGNCGVCPECGDTMYPIVYRNIYTGELFRWGACFSCYYWEVIEPTS